MYICTNVRLYVCMYVRTYVCMYVCMYVRTVLLRKKLAYYARSHARPFTRSTPVRFTPNARARMRTFSLVRHSTGTP